MVIRQWYLPTKQIECEMTEQLAAAMKKGMRELASGVAILACREKHIVRAMTVTSITSVSDNPPSLLVCVHHDSSTAKALASNPYFSLSVLAMEQAELANHCAFGPEEARTECGLWGYYGEQSIPYPRDTLATFFCHVTSQPQHGTHKVVFGQIDGVQTGSETQYPLIYVRGDYHSLQ